MVVTNGRTVTVFGGTGFLGRRIVRHLRDREFPVRIASRHPDRGHSQLGRDDPQLRSVYADIHDERSVADALAGAYAVVNTVHCTNLYRSPLKELELDADVAIDTSATKATVRPSRPR
jgi:uncharacterized protein YbjT (DUF2867 family)